MNQTEFTIQTMSREELNLAVSWAANEGWNPGLYDADPFYATDPQGFLIGKLNGEPVGSISCVSYGETFGFIGFYIVKPEYRGERYAFHLGNAALKYLEGRNIGLDGVLSKQEHYANAGFHLAYRNIRYEGIIEGKPMDGIVPLSSVPFEKTLEYDRRCFPAPRETFLRAWLRMPNISALAKMEGGVLKGFGAIRSCRVGYKIGPLFADDERIAEDLFLTLALQTGGNPLYLDTPEVNSAATALADRYAMKRVFETARMYTQNNPDIDLDRVFGVTTFELG